MKIFRLKITLIALLLALFALTTTSASAADKKDAGMEKMGNIATMWLIWPKAGDEMKFESAVKQHAAWRKSAGENMVWQMYQPIVGKDLGYYVIRSGNHHWKDFDANAEWHKSAKADEAFSRDVGPFVERAEHYFEESDLKDSHWIESDDYRYFGVTNYTPKSGTGADREDAIKKIHKAVTDGKWPYGYQINYGIGGAEMMTVVVGYKSYADMAEPDPSMMKMLATSLGSEDAAKATLKQFGSSVDGSDYTVVESRPDLSTPK
ncbi:MAG: hypothetical protein ABIP56_06245 [Dokdonella sp.]